jgi:hypothetical protein
MCSVQVRPHANTNVWIQTTTRPRVNVKLESARADETCRRAGKKFAHSCTQLHTVTHSYTQLHTVTHSYTQLHTVTHSCTRSHTVSHTLRVLCMRDALVRDDCGCHDLHGATAL